MSAKATIEIRDVIQIWIEFRAPKKGDLAWSVPEGATPEEALEHVVCGRDDWPPSGELRFGHPPTGEAGFGYRAHRDLPEFETVDEDDDLGPLRYRNIVVYVEHVRTEPRLNNVIPHVKLL
jgi:hypothetical protein